MACAIAFLCLKSKHKVVPANYLCHECLAAYAEALIRHPCVSPPLDDEGTASITACAVAELLAESKTGL